MEKIDWTPWLSVWTTILQIYLPNAYAVEFLRHNLARERLDGFAEELTRAKASPDEHAAGDSAARICWFTIQRL